MSVSVKSPSEDAFSDEPDLDDKEAVRVLDPYKKEKEEEDDERTDPSIQEIDAYDVLE